MFFHRPRLYALYQENLRLRELLMLVLTTLCVMRSSVVTTTASTSRMRTAELRRLRAGLEALRA